MADVFMTNAADLAARALTSLGYNFIATARPDVVTVSLSAKAHRSTT